jgi:hypothetical protein
MRRILRYALVVSALFAAAPSVAEERSGAAPPQWELEARRQWAARVERARDAYEEFARHAQSGRRRDEARSDARHSLDVGLTAFLDDSTLRSGDLVVTENGLRMFVGAHEPLHSLASFVDIEEAGAQSPQLDEARRAVALAPR